MGTITTTTINTMCSSDWLTSSGVFVEQPRTEKKTTPQNESDPYGDIDSHTDTGAAYEPSQPEKKAPPQNESDPSGDIDSHTDTGADYGLKNVKAKRLAMCEEPITPDGKNVNEDDLGDVSDPDDEVYGFVPRRFQHDVIRFADDAIIFLARASKKTPVPSDRKPNGCDGDVPDGPYPEGSDNNSGSSSPSEPYDLPGLPPSWDEVLV